MNTLDFIRDLYSHMNWADAIIWKSVQESPAAQSDALIRTRMHHIHVVQHAFLNVWRGTPYIADLGKEFSLADLLPWAKSYHEQVWEYFKTVDRAVLDSEMIMPWARMAMEKRGREASATTLGETMIQVAMHSLYHRGQVSVRLKELSFTPPLTDYIIWLWSGRPLAEWPAGGPQNEQ